MIEVFRNQMNANLVYVDATDRFLDKLAGVEDPEEKRKIIGGEFIEVFAEEARKLDGIEFLAQGTIWPDILESEDGIKAHHNAGGLPEDMNFELVEPVRILFKDEVRVVGDELGLPHGMVYRQQFFVRNLRRTDSKERSGSILLLFRISDLQESRMENVLLNGLVSFVQYAPSTL